MRTDDGYSPTISCRSHQETSLQPRHYPQTFDVQYQCPSHPSNLAMEATLVKQAVETDRSFASVRPHVVEADPVTNLQAKRKDE
jgi:hypothetical protein